jgi:hypothetical protein
MTLQRHSRRIGSEPSAAQLAAKRRLRRSRRTITAADDAAVITFLSDVLVGDATWTLGEVQRLVALRDQTGLSQEDEARFEDPGTTLA